jgi:hypothetical protein
MASSLGKKTKKDKTTLERVAVLSRLVPAHASIVRILRKEINKQTNQDPRP